ncbi:MAG: amino acid permease [Sedimentisphaerales bacterium]|nr:amino acid permease [Sedimentisphaerales bacterium]
MKTEKGVSNGQDGKFGTFGGVFTPSVLTILGVIMFLRFSTVVGYAGLWASLLILLAAKVITITNAMSLSSISTNMRVKGGGAYYLISRSLGIKFGGVIAVFFFIAQAIAVTLYVVGFTEAIFSAFPGIGLSFHTVATLTNIAVFACVYIGAGWTIRIQYGILAILIVSIGSFYLGAFENASMETLKTNLLPSWSGQNTLPFIFALFFPAVTGIMAGVNMSGDLKDPSRSIPRGTFAAIGFTFIVYAGIAVLLAASNSRSTLTGEGFVMKNTASSGILIYAGVICATLSSALGSMLGAPRILQAFALDNVFKRLSWFGYGSGTLNEPRRATVLTFVIAQIGIMAGDLNTIAPIITMFFLLTYGTLNLACFSESITKNPSFRPTFKMNHWTIALLGALGCLAVMFLINIIWAIVAILMAFAMYLLIERAKIVVQWGDLSSGLAFQNARKALLRLEKKQYHPKNWRPSILALSGNPQNRLHLVSYACLLSADRGVVSLGHVITGQLEDRLERQIEAEKMLRRFIAEEQLDAFPAVVVDENFTDGLKALIQCHGIGGLRPNTVLIGWSDDTSKSDTISMILNISQKMKRNVLVVRCQQGQEKWKRPGGAINIWWSDSTSNPMMLLLAFLLKENREWRDCPLRILRPVPIKADIENMQAEMEETLSTARIDAQIIILPTDNPFRCSQKRDVLISRIVCRNRTCGL